MTLLFAAAMFVNALLLFLVQPMFAKLLLPLFGGSPAVWTTCMLFFQSALLAGYAYSHSVVKLQKSWQQATVHIIVMALPILTLPLTVSTSVSVAEAPISSVLRLSALSVGAPFFALATGAPLLQRWFAAAQRRAAVDPYFLYAASNVGSLASLILYPTLIEPAMTLSTQTRIWSIGYSAAVLFTLVCAAVMWRRAPAVSSPTTSIAHADGAVVTWSRRARWIALAFVPSSLMLAVTAYLSTDVAAVPLLWIIPLALYLISFIVTFSTYSRPIVAVCNRVLPLVLLSLTWLLITEARLPLVPMSAHLVTFFIIATLCHGMLAEDRPATTHLTDFYLSLAVGGALGGAFNTLLAPVLFKSVLEYPLALALGIVLLTFRPGTKLRSRGRWWVEPAMAAALTVAALKWPGSPLAAAAISWGLVLGAAIVCASVARERRRFGVSVLVMLGLYAVLGGRSFKDVVYASRTFFGTYRVVSQEQPRSFTLFQGTTIHGRQDVSSDEPLTYFHRESPIAQVFASRPPGTVASVGIVGLGTGTLAAYAQAGQRWQFYEIDPEVERIARDTRYFTHLDSCGTACQVIIGDARQSLMLRTDVHDLIVLDAFSSDSVPVHLLTREAVAMYLSRLSDEGVIAINISNNHLDLRPVVAGLMRELGLSGRVQLQVPKNIETGRYPSHWAVIARSDAALGPVANNERWRRLPSSDIQPWTDDFSNIWTVIQWRRVSI